MHIMMQSQGAGPGKTPQVLKVDVGIQIWDSCTNYNCTARVQRRVGLGLTDALKTMTKNVMRQRLFERTAGD